MHVTTYSKPVAVIGLGKTGVSVLNYLHMQKIACVAFDTRKSPPGLAEIQKNYPNLPIHLGELSPALLLQACEIVVAPGLSTQLPALQAAAAAGIPIVGDIELFARVVNKPVIGITGSNGKSTVTSLLGLMAEQDDKRVFVGGNLGTPVLNALQNPDYELYILELSSFQLETTYSLKLAAATILNITPDHMDRYADFAAYAAAKQRIYQQADTAIFNRQDKTTQPPTAIKQAISFGTDTPKAGEFGLIKTGKDIFLAYADEIWINARTLQIHGQHNLANALAALALGHAVGLTKTAMLKALQAFPGLPHRSQWVGQFAGVDWYNDSKGTNIDATLATLQGFAETGQKIILIAGGEGKGADFSALALIAEHVVRTAILFGKDKQLIANALAKACPTIIVDTLNEAVTQARQNAVSGDIVLLSPACASLDMFNNFEHRGNEFMRLAREL